MIAGIDSAADPAAQPLSALALGGLDASSARGPNPAAPVAARGCNPYATGARERVAGTACDVYAKLDGGEPRSFASRYADLGLNTADARTLRAVISLLRQTGGPWLPLADCRACRCATPAASAIRPMPAPAVCARSRASRCPPPSPTARLPHHFAVRMLALLGAR